MSAEAPTMAEVARALNDRACAEQGLPRYIEDPIVLHRLGLLISETVGRGTDAVGVKDRATSGGR